MNLHRALTEVRELKTGLKNKFCGRLSYDFSGDAEIRLEGVKFPMGWTNNRGQRHGRVLMRLPDTYPEDPPQILIDEAMRFEGDRPVEMSPSKLDDDADWAPFSIFPADNAWDPETHSLAIAFQMLQNALQDPSTQEIPTGAGSSDETADEQPQSADSNEGPNE